jgi:hypothetical protein
MTIAEFARETGIGRKCAARAIHGQSYQHLDRVAPPVPIKGAKSEQVCRDHSECPQTPVGSENAAVLDGRWSVERVIASLIRHGETVTSHRPIGNGYGTAIRTERGAIVNVFRTGKISCQGKHIGEVGALFGLSKDVSIPAPQDARSVSDAEIPSWITDTPPNDAPQWLDWEPCTGP